MKTICITGASSGIGKVTAQLFQKKGWNVVATMRTPEKEQDLGKLDNVLVARLDVQDPQSIQTAIKQAIGRFKTIDVMLNNAGYGAFGILEAAPIEKIRRQFEVNVIGLLQMTQAVLPHFRAQKSGILINVSSIGGKMTFPLGTLYHGTKFAVEGISEALVMELQQIGCTVKIIEPGAIATDFGTRSLDFFNDETLAEYQPLIQGMLGAFDSIQAAPPDIVADVIFQAATDGNDQMRYSAGEDAKKLLEARKKLDDKEFNEALKAHLGM